MIHTHLRLRVVRVDERRDPTNIEADTLYICMGDTALKEITPVVLEVFNEFDGQWHRIEVFRK